MRDRLVALAQNRGSGRRVRVLEFLQRLAHALHDALRRPGRIALAFVIALVFHGICIAMHSVLGLALGIHLSLSAWALVYAGVSVLMLLPISVAGIGLREGGYVGLLALCGVPRESALALSFVLFGYMLLGALIGFSTEIVTGKARIERS